MGAGGSLQIPWCEVGSLCILLVPFRELDPFSIWNISTLTALRTFNYGDVLYI